MARRQSREPTIALINIVFLMLVFFMVAGTLAPALDPGLTLVDTRALDPAAPPDALVLHADGHLSLRGAAVTLDSFAPPETGPVRIVPDRNADAARLVAVSQALTARGAQQVLIVTEQALR